MKRALSFAADLSLVDLASRLGRFEALCGALAAIGHQDQLTIGNYDDEAEGNGVIVLKLDTPGGDAPGALIASGTVYVEGVLENVRAYRRVAPG